MGAVFRPGAAERASAPHDRAGRTGSLHRRVEQEGARAAHGPDAAALRRLEKLANEVDTNRALLERGRSAPVILDDAIVCTDDERIERIEWIFDALHRQAEDLQIIVLSCRQRAFRELGGRKLRLAPATAALEPAE